MFLKRCPLIRAPRKESVPRCGLIRPSSPGCATEPEFFSRLPNSKSSFNAQLWEVAYPAGNTLRITNDLNYYAGASITGDDVTLATNQLSFSSSLSIAPAGSAGLSEPRQITSGVGRSDGLAGIAWTSSRIFYTYYASGVLRLASISPKGGDLRDVVTAGSPAWPSACQKDGSFVFSVIDGAGHAAVWHGDADGVTLKPITSGPEDERPSCSPDGKFVIYQAVSPAPVRIMKVAIGGGAPIAVSNQHLESPVISPDGRSFAASYEPGPDKPARLAIVGIESGEVQNIYNLPQGADTRPSSRRDSRVDQRRALHTFLGLQKRRRQHLGPDDCSPRESAAPAAPDHEFLIRNNLVVWVVPRRQRFDFRPRPPHQRRRSNLPFPLSPPSSCHPNEVRDLHFAQHSQAAAYVPSLLPQRESSATP